MKTLTQKLYEWKLNDTSQVDVSESTSIMYKIGKTYKNYIKELKANDLKDNWYIPVNDKGVIGTILVIPMLSIVFKYKGEATDFSNSRILKVKTNLFSYAIYVEFGTDYNTIKEEIENNVNDIIEQLTDDQIKSMSVYFGCFLYDGSSLSQSTLNHQATKVNNFLLEDASIFKDTLSATYTSEDGAVGLFLIPDSPKNLKEFIKFIKK